MPLVPTYSERHGEPFDLFTSEGAHWGKIRLSQYGQSVTLEVMTDASAIWKDFQAFQIMDGRLMYATTHASKKGTNARTG